MVRANNTNEYGPVTCRLVASGIRREIRDLEQRRDNTPMRDVAIDLDVQISSLQDVLYDLEHRGPTQAVVLGSLNGRVIE